MTYDCGTGIGTGLFVIVLFRLLFSKTACYVNSWLARTVRTAGSGSNVDIVTVCWCFWGNFLCRFGLLYVQSPDPEVFQKMSSCIICWFLVFRLFPFLAAVSRHIPSASLAPQHPNMFDPFWDYVQPRNIFLVVILRLPLYSDHSKTSHPATSFLHPVTSYPFLSIWVNRWF